MPFVDNDYINAVYINGFNYIKEFIVTEVPLKEMRYAFWHMVNDQNIDTICLLNTIESHCVVSVRCSRLEHLFFKLKIYLPYVFLCIVLAN